MKEIKFHQKRLAVIPLIVALLSLFVVSRVATSAEFHASSIAALDEKQTTVLELVAVSTAASAAITLLPGDTATPIAEKLADLSSYFLLVLCAIYLEKYLLTITGYAAFRVLIPIACVLYALHICLRRDRWKALARKLVIFAMAIVLVIPVSLKVSGLIEETYQASIQATLETAKETTEAMENGVDAGEEEAKEGLLSGLVSKVTGGISGVSEKIVDLVNSFMEALAVLLVTSCVIPILVLLFFVWLVKIMFALPSRSPDALPKAVKEIAPGGRKKEEP